MDLILIVRFNYICINEYMTEEDDIIVLNHFGCDRIKNVEQNAFVKACTLN